MSFESGSGVGGSNYVEMMGDKDESTNLGPPIAIAHTPKSTTNAASLEDTTSLIFVRYSDEKPELIRHICGPNECIYKFFIHYQRYVLTIYKTFDECLEFQGKMQSMYTKFMTTKHIEFLSKKSCMRYFLPCCCWKYDTQAESKAIERFLTTLFEHIKNIGQPYFKISTISNFLGVTEKSFFAPHYGRIGFEGYFQKNSGGNFMKIGNSVGDYIRVWSNRYVVFRDTHIAWYMYQNSTEPQGCFLIDSSFTLNIDGDRIVVTNKIMRKEFSVATSIFTQNTHRKARQVFEILSRFYAEKKNNIASRDSVNQVNNSSYPVRPSTDCRIYTLPCDYFASVAVHLLAAQKEIFITSWKNSPHITLTRPPLPPLCLDQILKFKADQGVKIYILLYKEVDFSGQGNDSHKALTRLMALSPNISCIRHPNKFMGGSTALLWSHHEKIVVIDRNIAFVGGIDLAYNRWDDDKHSLSDEYGTIYPGRDYRQPALGKYKPAKSNIANLNIVRKIDRSSLDNDDNEDDEEVHFLADDAQSVISTDSQLQARNIQAIIAQVGSDITTAVNNAVENIKRRYRFEVRDLYPRMPWHDVHAVFSGPAARDVGNHFVHRWNHHRISSRVDRVELTDVTDDKYFGICAKCMNKNLNENLTNCPFCKNYLGPISYFLQPLRMQLLPPNPSDFNFITYRCAFKTTSSNLNTGYGISGLSFTGDTPASVYLADLGLLNTNVVKCTLIETQGPDSSKWVLFDSDYLPQAGDVVIDVDGIAAGHLDSDAVTRLIKIRQMEAVSRDFSSRSSSRKVSTSTPNLVEGDIAVLPEELTDLDEVQRDHVDVAPHMCIFITFRRHVVGKDSRDLTPEGMMTIVAPEAKQHHSIEIFKDGIVVDAESATSSAPRNSIGSPISQKISNTIYSPMLANSIIDTSGVGAESAGKKLPHNNKVLDSAIQEQKYNMSLLFHESRHNIDHLSSPVSEGTCKVQVLRSCGPWSAAIPAETSIQQCWINLIKHSEKFVYIENQFFISNPNVKTGQTPNSSTEDVLNGIAEAVLTRMINAALKDEEFRVIIVIPQHPNGDLPNSVKPRTVMHFEFVTIRNILRMFRERMESERRQNGLRMVDPFKYINFYCLNNCGVVNNHVFVDQVYVHDKILIVDDRVMIVGSANVNDRSMLGSRDSEMAVCIEDTSLKQITLGKKPFVVGEIVHNTRLKLMSEHTHSLRSDLVDIVDQEVFKKYWDDVAANNVRAMDAFLDTTSVYKCKKLKEYKSALADYPARKVNDPVAQKLLKDFKGFLAHWPMNFLSGEDLSPSLAMALVGNDVWV